MIVLHRPVLTQQPRVPWSWLLLINLCWFGTLYTIFIMTTALPLTLLRFTNDTRLIAFVTSVGGLMGIVIGPCCNYISDRLWSRWGRRRPFLLIAMLGTLAAVVLIPYMPSVTPLVLLVVVSSLLGDVGSTFEPLWLEVIPPEQRGRGVVMRNVMISVASLYFFQVMFAQFDNRYYFDLTRWHGPRLLVTGEQLTYAAAVVMTLYTIIFLWLFVREVRPQGVALQRLREMDFSPVRFIARFVRDVFGDRRWWPIYLFYISAGIFGAGTGTFGSLMQVDQFKYAKSAIALMGLPGMLLSILVMAPILGWQADRFKRFAWWLLGGIALLGVVSGGVLVRAVYPALAPDALPPLWVMFALAICANLTFVPLCFGLTQYLNARQPQRNKRLWPWLLNTILAFMFSIITLLYLKVFLCGQTPPVAHWYLLSLITGAGGTFGALAGPLLYEYLPTDKIGTISSGFGMLSTAVGAIMANVMGFWIYYWSAWFGDGTGKDYTATMWFGLLSGPVALGIMVYFFRLATRGGLVEYGKLKLNADGSPVTVNSPAAP